MKGRPSWLAAMGLSLLCTVLQASAQTASDYTEGVSVTGTTATLWFAPTSTQTTWVDVHYQQNGGTQQNLRMSWNAATGRDEQAVLTSVAKGDLLSYGFTYNKGTPAYNTPTFSYTVGGSASAVATPTFSPGAGNYSSAQTVAIATTTAGATIHYTINGNTPTVASKVYSSPIAVARTETLKAIAVKSGMKSSAVASAAYTITAATVAPPTFTPPAGSYASAQQVSIASATAGATIHYTTDGSTPTASSPTYKAALAVASSETLRAIAMKSGLNNSTVALASYTIGGGTWNGQTTFNLVNGTRGTYASTQVYWAIVGLDWNTNQYVHVDANGALIPMSMADNGALSKNGQSYTNYFNTLAQAPSVTIPPINSARLYLSVGGPMYIQVVTDVNGNIGYTGPNIENPSDPNINVTFDFVEMAIVPSSGFYGNTTRVDQFGFPLTMRVQGLGGYDQTVGETETRSALFNEFLSAVPEPFQGLAQAPYSPYRIIAPAHASFDTGGSNANYLDAYIGQMWSLYASQTLTFTDAQGTFTGHVVNGQFQFSDGQGTYTIARAPTTPEALLGNGVLNDATGQTPGTPGYDKQLQIQAQMCAAINRHIVSDPAHWGDSSFFYPAGQAANWYAQFWHAHSLNGLAYGFAYDDVDGYSSSLQTTAPTTVTVTVGW